MLVKTKKGIQARFKEGKHVEKLGSPHDLLFEVLLA